MEEIFENLVRKGVVTKYYGSNIGNVVRIWKGKMKLKKQHTRKDGYKQVCLNINGESINELTHRIIAMCFLPNPHNYKEVNHIDPKDKGNNHVSNLEWCDRKQNMTHAKENGLMKPCKGEKIGSAKLKEADVIEIFRLYNVEKWLQKRIAKHFGISQKQVSRILRRERWGWFPIPAEYL